MKNFYYILLIIIIPLLNACEEDTIVPTLYGSISGLIVDEGSNVVIQNAIVSTNPATSVLETDTSGRFVFENIKTGTYTLRIEKDGYITDLETVSVYEDQTASVTIKLQADTLNNHVPTLPFSPSPGIGADTLNTNLTLSWRATDQDSNDVLKYDVLFFNNNQSNPITIAENITDTFFSVNNLDYNTTYFWQVIVNDEKAASVYGPIWSFKTKAFPDNRVLFTREINGKFDIYSTNTNGTDIIKLTDNNASNWRPRMNPARTRIAYISNWGIETQIRIMDRDGKNDYQVTTIPIAGFNEKDLDFCWSPDGSKLLYMNNAKMYAVNIDGTGVSLMMTAPPSHTFSEVDWNGNSSKIAARTTATNSYNSILLLYDNTGTYISQLQADAAGHTGGPAFNINGNYILYTQDIDGFEPLDGRQLNSHIFLKNIINQSVIDLSEGKTNGTNDLDARISPDGSKVIFMNTNNDGISIKSIWIMDLNGDNRTKILDNAEMPDWK